MSSQETQASEDFAVNEEGDDDYKIDDDCDGLLLHNDSDDDSNELLFHDQSDNDLNY